MELPHELEELRKKQQWVCHQNKIPKNPNTGGNARANDFSTWSDYDTAVAAMGRWNFDGVGFQFGDFEPYSLRVSGIDLDHVVRSDGTLEPFAREIVERMNSYTEYSPSGTGLHILCYTRTANIFGNKVTLATEGGKDCGLEMYTCKRYFTITGKVYGEPRPVSERTKEFDLIHEKYFASRVSQPSQSPDVVREKKSSSSGVIQKSISMAHSPVYESDTELLDKMFSSQRGAEIRALFGGDVSSYGNDDSSADLALCSYLAFWTRGDAKRMDLLFRQSGLMRPKWDELRGVRTYGEMTISRALVNSEVRASSGVMRMDNVSNVKGSENQKSQVNTVVSKTEAEKSTQPPTVDIGSVISRNVSAYIRRSVKDWGIKIDLDRFHGFINRKTGFSNIDEKMSLYPGLYVLGAISSLGKTTFVHQMSDQLVKAGEHVLFFSLEQSQLELVTKGLSRLMAQNDMRTAMSSIDIRHGRFSHDEQKMILGKVLSDYSGYTEHEMIVECDFSTSVLDIIETVKEYIKKTHVLPIVVVDYLQVLYPMDSRLSTRDSVDMNVRALKELQKDHDLVVILVSSLNRANYLTPIDFESFKESGGIEYTADVIWGLQLRVMNDEIFDKEKGLKTKREKVRAAKKEKPRKIEFVCLKNRYGESSYSCYFDYYAQYDYFVPSKSNEFYAGGDRL